MADFPSTPRVARRLEAATFVGQSASAPFFYAYQWDDRAAGGFGSRIAPASPGGQVYSLAWHPGGRFLAVGHATSPFLRVYPFNPRTGAFSAALANPSTIPTSACRGVAWSPDGSSLFAVNNSAPYVHAWAFDASGGGAWGAKAADAPTPSQFDARAVAVHQTAPSSPSGSAPRPVSALSAGRVRASRARGSRAATWRACPRPGARRAT